MKNTISGHAAQRLARIILLTSALVAAVISFTFDWSQLGIQFPLTITILLASTAAFVIVSKKQLAAHQLVFLTSALILAIFIWIRGDPVLSFFNFTTSVFLLLMVGTELAKGKLRNLRDYIAAIFLPLEALQKLPGTVAIASLSKRAHLDEQSRRILRGLIIALPLVIIFGVLFASADAVFANLAGSIFSFEVDLSGETVARLIAAGSLFLIFSSIFGRAFLAQKTTEQSSEELRVNNVSVELSIVLGLLNGLFALFLVIQALYLFGGREFVLDGELTYAEYGRRGFFELVSVAGLVFALSLLTKRYYNAARLKLPTLLIIVLFAQVGVIMISALRRLSSYEDVFGFTSARFYSHSFIFFLAVAFGILTWSIYARKTDAKLLRVLTGGIVAYLIILNAINPHAFIAKQNIDRFTQTGKIDSLYIARSLSSDAALQQIQVLDLLQGEDIDTVNKFMNQFCINKTQLAHDTSSWSTWHLGREKAANIYEQTSLTCRPL